MARLLLLFVAAMILAAHASLIPGVSQFLKLDYLTKLLKLYACFYELKELRYNTFFCFLISGINFYRLTTSVINTTDEDTHFNQFITRVFFADLYTFKVSKDMYESIKVDANKESETFSLSHASSGKKEGDSVYDFNKVRN